MSFNGQGPPPIPRLPTLNLSSPINPWTAASGLASNNNFLFQLGNRGRGRGGRTKQTSRNKPIYDTDDQQTPTGEVLQHDFDASDEEAAEANDNEGRKTNGSDIPTDPTGTRLEVKRVDEVYDRKRSEWTTRDTIVPKKKDKKDPYDSYAFTVNRKFNPTSDPTLHVITTTLDIKSTHLKTVGMEVIKDVQGISWTAKPLKIDPQVFLAFLPDLEAFAAGLRAKDHLSEDDELSLKHLDFFLDYLRTEHVATLEELHSLLANGQITFELLWALLVPRTIFYTPCAVTGEPRAVRLIHAEQVPNAQGNPFWRLDIESVEFNMGDNGPKFGLAQLQSLEIPNFKGATKITSLPSYPLKYYHGKEELLKILINRGKKWMDLQGVHHRYYNGTGYHFKDGKYVKLNTNSRVMIDAKTFNQTIPNYEFPVVSKTIKGDDIDKHPVVFSEEGKKKNEDLEQLSEEDFIIASPIVYGFSLSDKLWLEFAVEKVTKFEWNDEPFENLVLPRNQKSLIQSLVEAHSLDNTGFDDFVEGKGRGLVINLFGNPGVGKSLTAEATSEHVRRPLYVVGAGDLGTSAAMLDINLTRIFNISSNWGAVVLIDEADVFLEERSFHDLERNAMVAVFLRQLEYFKGILFLTTNRVRTFDEAFQSRIHVALRYQDLQSDAKRQIWTAFMKKATGKSDGGLRPDEVRELGEKRVNGRQIKNVVRTANAIASSQNEQVKYGHLIQVLDMMEQFDNRHAMYQ